MVDNERTKPIVAFPKAFLFSQLAYQSIDQSIHQQAYTEDLLWDNLRTGIEDIQIMVPSNGLNLQLGG